MSEYEPGVGTTESDESAIEAWVCEAYTYRDKVTRIPPQDP